VPASDAAAIGTSIAAASTSTSSGKRRRRQREQRSEQRSATTLNDTLSPSSPGTDYSLDPEARYRHAHNRNLSNSTGIGAQSSTAPLSS
jgi:hypothetical protein